MEPAGTENLEKRFVEIETKLTFLEDFVAKQNEVIVAQSNEISRLKKALRQISEKLENLGNDNIFPANEKPPHW